MVYEYKSPTSFTFTANGENGDKAVQSFALRDNITNWQLGKVSLQVGKLLKDSPDFVKMIINLIGTVSSESPEKLKGALAERFGEAVGEAFLGEINAEIFTGFGDLLAYMGENQTIPLICAAMFLKDSESRLDEKIYKERVELFDSLPTHHFVGALQHFFTKGRASLKNTPSPSQISETTMKSDTPLT